MRVKGAKTYLEFFAPCKMKSGSIIKRRERKNLRFFLNRRVPSESKSNFVHDFDGFS